MGDTKEKPLKLRMCEICQQTSYIEDITKVIQTIKECSAVDRYAYIIHDKDIDEHGNLKPEHIHIMIRFAYSYKVLSLARMLNIQPQYFQKIQSPKFEDALLYLNHANAPEKFQYPAEAVIANFNYKSICERYMKKKASSAKKMTEDELVKQYCEDIIDGKIKRYNYFDIIDHDLCVRYKGRFDNAFKVRDDILRTKERNLEVLYLTGDSGTGKTTYAKEIAKKHNYSYYVSSASNDVLDSYAGQDVLILDDMRPSCLGLSDLLKLLDNHTASTARSRYYNKILECKMIILTTVIDIEEFFNHVFTEQKEPLVQLKRRCSTYMQFTKNEIRVSMYDATLQDYTYIHTLKNPVADMFPTRAVTTSEAKEKLRRLLGDYEVTNEEDWLTAEESPFPVD